MNEFCSFIFANFVQRKVRWNIFDTNFFKFYFTLFCVNLILYSNLVKNSFTVCSVGIKKSIYLGKKYNKNKSLAHKELTKKLRIKETQSEKFVSAEN